MRVEKNLLAIACALAVFGIVGAAGAADSPSGKVPGSQGLESVDKNLARDRDSHGLNNAQSHVRDNIADRASRKRATHKPTHKVAHRLHRDRDERGMRAEKGERIDHPARPDHPERPGHS